MRRWLIGLLVLVAIVAAAFAVSPWPRVHVIRTVFDRGAAEASAKLEKHVPADVKTTELRYDPVDDDAMLDVIRPIGGKRAGVTVVWIHGGGFVSGKRADVNNYLKVLAGRGFNVVNVDYTIAPEATYPTPIRQVSKALDYLERNAGRLGLSNDRLVLAGDSAGAQIAAQTAAVIADRAYARRVGVVPRIEANRIAGVLLFCGVYDVTRMGEGGGLLGWFVKSTTWAYSGKRDWRDADGFETISVAPNVTEAFPPAFISAGNADPLGPQSVALADALEAKGVNVERLFFPAAYEPPLGHEYQFDLDTPAGRTALDRSAQWLRDLAVEPPVR